MPVSQEYLEFVLDQLSGVGILTSRRMFGGVGIYIDGTFCAIIAEDTLYLKTGLTNRRDFEAVGMRPFRPFIEQPNCFAVL